MWGNVLLECVPFANIVVWCRCARVAVGVGEFEWYGVRGESVEVDLGVEWVARGCGGCWWVQMYGGCEMRGRVGVVWCGGGVGVGLECGGEVWWGCGV